MVTYTDWLNEPGALWYCAQALLLMLLAYATGCIFGCWFRRIQPQPVEVAVSAPQASATEPRPAPVVPRAPAPENGGRLRKAFEGAEPVAPAPAPAPERRPAPEPALTMEAIRGALAQQGVIPAPAVPAAPVVVPAPVAPAAAVLDDLKRIKGIGPEIERKLNVLGVKRYQDIVRWSAADVDRIGASIGTDIRITHENWIEQAAILAAGGETMFSRRVDRKEVLASPKDTWMPVAPTQVERQGMVTADAKPRVPTADPRKAASAVAASAAEIGRRIEAPVVPGAVQAPARAASAAEAAAAAAGQIVLKPVAASETAKPVAPAPAKPAAGKEPDDLKRIRGITPELERQLNALGVNRFAQIASWSPQAVEKASSVLNVGPRVTQENWVEQATILARGGETEYSRRLKQGGAVPVVAAPAAVAPAAGGPPDDLKRIRGVGVVIETKLNAMGVRNYADIARWTATDVGRFSEALDIPGRIEKENWVGQAQVLASGQATEFSNRVDRGDVAPSKE